MEEVFEDQDDDGLGYYEDGMKRTLTDEQIAIFRHSEIQALLRDRRNAYERHKKDERNQAASAPEEGELDDGEIEDVLVKETSSSSRSSPCKNPPNSSNATNLSEKMSKKAKKAKKAEQARQRGFFKQNIKPDLRKRTWDKVDSGIESLDYDEESAAPMPNPVAQRRRITYDD